MTVTSSAHEWIALDGAKFSYSMWKSEAIPLRAVMVAVHGLSGAALDFEPLGRHLAPLGLTTLAIELRGQGNDPVAGNRGDLVRVEDWYSDLHTFLALVRRDYPSTPIYSYGESMGAAILTRFLAQAPLLDQPAGLILASPVVALPRRASWWQQILFHLFIILLPTLRVNVRKFAKPKKGEPPPYVTRDENHRKWFETAPHRLEGYTVRFFKCLYQLIEGCWNDASRIQVPVLVIYAAHDVFIPPHQVEAFVERLGSREKEMKFFPDSYHLLLHDQDSHLVLWEIEQWLTRRMES